MDYSADFETTTNPEDCRVWAWCVCEINDPDHIWYGNTIDGFLKFAYDNGGTYYFHNASFDCEFILWHLLTNGYTYSEKLETRTFKTLISAMGKFYSMEVCFEKRGHKKMRKAMFKDSLKKLPMRVEEVAMAFKLPISKLSIDYDEYRAPGHDLTQVETDYIKNDVQIVAMALAEQFGKGLDRMTIGSDALNHYRNEIGSAWGNLFPKLHIEMDALIRKSYRGGWTYADPRYQSSGNRCDEIRGEGSVYDVNSLYPDVMYNRPLPVGRPVYFHGKYEDDEEYPLYIQFLTCSCKLKKDHLPTLQIKNNPYYAETEYLSETDGYVDLALTSVDLDLLMQQYEVDVAYYKGGFKFHQAQGMFKNYIDYWMDVKAHSTGGTRTLAKLMLNSLYGKFATNPDVTPKIPYMREDGTVGYKLGEKETRDPVYTPMGCFITAWARYKTVTTAQTVYDRFMYADTDSIHVLGTEPVEGIEVHPTNLGAWKHESNFSRSKYVRAKTYIERIVQVGEMVDGKYVMVDVEPYNDVKCAGMPKELKEKVTFENFKSGLKIPGKLRPKHCKGGIVLVPTTFTMV